MLQHAYHITYGEEIHSLAECSIENNLLLGEQFYVPCLCLLCCYASWTSHITTLIKECKNYCIFKEKKECKIHLSIYLLPFTESYVERSHLGTIQIMHSPGLEPLWTSLIAIYWASVLSVRCMWKALRILKDNTHPARLLNSPTWVAVITRLLC